MKRVAPAAERNKGPILEKLKEILPASTKKILEISSGTGQHIAHFAKAFKEIIWQPTEFDTSSIHSIQAYINEDGLDNVQTPEFVDVSLPIESWTENVGGTENVFDAIYSANMIHITPWNCTTGLFSAAGRLLKSGGLLITYGPYSVDSVLSPDSNVQFNLGLKSTNSEWGIRDVKDLKLLASANKLKFQQSFEMPANNKILVFKKID